MEPRQAYPVARKAVLEYHDLHAQFPLDELSMAKRVLEKMIPRFTAALEKEDIHYRFEQAGSAHGEKAHITHWDGHLELDVEFVIQV